MSREERIKKFIRDKMLSESETGKVSTVKEDSGNFHRGKLIGSKFGVTGATLEAYRRKTDPNFIATKESIASVDLDTASKIAYDEYYKKYNIDKIADENLAMNVLDFAYNSGGNRALRWLRKTVQDKQKAEGKTNQLRVGKGKLDEEALNIINSKYITNNDYSDQRQQYIDIIYNKEKNKKFKKGWTNRVNSLRTEEQSNNEVPIETDQATLPPLSSNNPLGDLNPLASTMGSEMAEKIENPDKQFTLVRGPEGQEPEKTFTLVSGPEGSQPTEAPQPEQPSRPEFSMGQSFMKGVGQGFSYGFEDEISAGAATVNDVLTTDLGKQVVNDTLASFTKAQLDGDQMPITRLAEQYRKHKNSEKELVDQYRTDNPLSYMAGDLAGTALNYATVGPFAFGAGVLTRGGSVLYGTLSGIAHEAGRTEAQTIEGAAKDMAIGGAIGGIGEAMMPAYRAGVEAVTDTLGKVRSSALVNFLTGGYRQPSKGGSLTAKAKLAQVGKQVDAFAERMVNYTDLDGTPLIKPTMNREDFYNSVNKNADVVGGEMSALLNQVDEMLGQPSINGYELRTRIREQIIKPMQAVKSLPEDKAVAAALDDYLINLTQSLKSVEQSVDPKTGANILKEVFEPQQWNLSELSKQKSQLQRMYRSVRMPKEADAQAAIQYRIAQGKDQIGSIMGDVIDETLAKESSKLGMDVGQQYVGLKQKYGDLAEASSFIKNQMNIDDGKSLLSRVFTDSIVRYTSAAGILGTTVGLPYAKTGIAIAGLRGVAMSKRFNGAITKSANEAIRIMEKNPEATAAIANRLVTSTSLSANDQFDNMTRAMAELTFIDQPLARDPNEVIRRADKILHLVEDIDPEMASNLSTAIDNRDLGSVSALMDQVIRAVPAQYIQPGIGFGGRAFSEEDIAKVNADISNIRNTRRRKELSTAFNNQSSESFRMIPKELYEEKQSDPANFFQFKKKQNKFIKDY